jgi:hypothetical protein
MVDVNLTDGMGRTPLICAAEKGHVHVCVLLLEHGADINKQDSNGRTALHHATTNGDVRTVQELLRWKKQPAEEVEEDQREDQRDFFVVEQDSAPPVASGLPAISHMEGKFAAKLAVGAQDTSEELRWLVHVLDRARQKWLTVDDILKILKMYRGIEKEEGLWPLKAAQRPQSGDVYLYSCKLCPNYRADGHAFDKKKSEYCSATKF